MDELKLLIDMVAALPAMAMWVLVGFFAYKVVIIGSIYGLVRFVVEKLHSWLTHQKTEKIDAVVDGILISGGKHDFLQEIGRLRGKGVSIASGYIHPAGVTWLREAIDDKEAKDRAEKARAAAG